MGQPADAHLTPELAQEIYQRTSSAAVLESYVASLGSQYVVGLRAKNCSSGDILDEEQVQAARKEDVLDALSQIASTFRTRVGESLATIAKHDKPLEDTTTQSLEAFKPTARPEGSFRQRSAALPFSCARLRSIRHSLSRTRFMGPLTANLENTIWRQRHQEAYGLRDRASDLEKFFITTVYDST